MRVIRSALLLLSCFALASLVSGDSFPPGYDLIRDEGTDENRRGAINFIGAGVSVADDSANNETEVTIAGGGSTNSFETVAVPAGTNPVADSATDTLTLTETSFLTITGTAGTDTIDITQVTTDLGTDGLIAANAVALTTDTTGNYVAEVADGTGIDGTAAAEGATYTPTFDATEISSLTWGAGAFTTMTFNAGATDPVLTATSGELTLSGGDFNVSKDNANVTVQHAAGRIFGLHTEAGNLGYLGSDAGVQYVTVEPDHAVLVGHTLVPYVRLLTNSTGNSEVVLPDDSVGASELDTTDTPADAESLTFDGATGRMRWDTAAGSGDITSVGDVGSGAAFDGTQGTVFTFNNAAGDQTLTYSVGADLDFNFSDDLNLRDATPHLQWIDTTAGHGDWEFDADANQFRFVDVTDALELWRVDPANRLRFDSPTMTVHPTDNVVLIGAVNSEVADFVEDKLEVFNGDINQYVVGSAAGDWQVHYWARARGTFTADGSTELKVEDGDIIGGNVWTGFDGGANNCETSRILGLVDGGTGASDVPGAMDFYTSSDGACGTTQRMRLKPDGDLGLGLTNPEAVDTGDPVLTVAGTSAAVQVTKGGTLTSGARFILNASRGTIDSPTQVQSGDVLGQLYVNARDDVNFESNVAELRVVVDGATGTNDLPTRLEFYTTPDGSVTPAVRLTINNAGVYTLEGGATDPTLTPGNATLTITPGGSDLIVADDLVLQDASPSLTLDPTSGDSFHFGVDASTSVGFINNATEGVMYLQMLSDHAMLYGSTSSTYHRFSTDSTGDNEFIVPNDSIGDAEVALTETIQVPIYSAKLTGAFVTAAITSLDTATQGAQLDAGDGNWRLLFDATTDEAAVWQLVLPDYWSAHGQLNLLFSLTSATTLQVAWEAATMCVSPGDAADVGTASFATGVREPGNTVPGTAGFLDSEAIDLTDDACAAGDLMFVYVSTDANHGTDDDATGDRELVGLSYEFTR